MGGIVVTNRLRRRVVFVAICLTALAISACAHQPAPTALEPPGFWSGLLHGFLILFSFVGSLFTDVRIYSFQILASGLTSGL